MTVCLLLPSSAHLVLPRSKDYDKFPIFHPRHSFCKHEHIHKYSHTHTHTHTHTRMRIYIYPHTDGSTQCVPFGALLFLDNDIA
jgi:hypothetical protein